MNESLQEIAKICFWIHTPPTFRFVAHQHELKHANGYIEPWVMPSQFIKIFKLQVLLLPNLSCLNVMFMGQLVCKTKTNMLMKFCYLVVCFSYSLGSGRRRIKTKNLKRILKKSIIRKRMLQVKHTVTCRTYMY